MQDFIKKYGFENYFVDDLINSSTEILFVLESPHVYEVKNGYPVAGKSGKDMSKVLLEDKTLKKEPFGKLIYEKKLPSLGIINISNIPLQELAYAQESEEFSTPFHKNLFKNFSLFRQNPILRKKESSLNELLRVFYKDFSLRLTPHKDKKVVLCGAFAQKVFYENFEANEFNAVIEVPHPSFNNWQKEKYKETIERLLEFIK